MTRGPAVRADPVIDRAVEQEVIIGQVRALADGWAASQGWTGLRGRQLLAVLGGEPAAPVPAAVVLCSACGAGEVAIPGVISFGQACEECIRLCNEADGEDHRCPVCSPEGSPSWPASCSATR